MGVLDQLKFGIARAQELGYTEVTTDLIRPLPQGHQTSVIRALNVLGYTVKYRGPMTFNFPHHLIKLRKKS